MAIEVFNRYEKKFIISDSVYHRIKPLLEEYMEPDKHSKNSGFYTICNIYYDTADHEIIRNSIEKPVYKEKLRLRSYGKVREKDKVFLEIKKKFEGRVNKRRTSILLEEANRYLMTREKPEINSMMNAQILNEIDYLVRRYPTLRPAIYLSYDRVAFFGKEDANLRITFDTNIKTRRYDLGLEYGNYGEPLIPDNYWIMEVKMVKSAPLWLSQLLSSHRIYPTSFSKYGTEYKKNILHKGLGFHTPEDYEVEDAVNL